jgi:hypothetical protein
MIQSQEINRKAFTSSLRITEIALSSQSDFMRIF